MDANRREWLLLRALEAQEEETISRSPPAPEPMPCDACHRAPRCAAEQLACTAFERFNAGLRWQISPRCDASRERFERIFGQGS